MFHKSPPLKKLEFLGDVNTDIIKCISEKAFIITILKLCLSLFLVSWGIYYILIGIKSDAALKISFNNFIFESNKAYPGTILFLSGLILALFSRLNIKISK